VGGSYHQEVGWHRSWFGFDYCGDWRIAAPEDTPFDLGGICAEFDDPITVQHHEHRTHTQHYGAPGDGSSDYGSADHGSADHGPSAYRSADHGSARDGFAALGPSAHRSADHESGRHGRNLQSVGTARNGKPVGQ